MEQKITALIIDDDQVDLLAIKRAIKLSGFNAEIVLHNSYDDGITEALSAEFDCIFVDYNLPGDNGLKFINEYKSKGGLAPIIVITSQGDERLAVEVMKAGACDYISKSLINAETVGKSIRFATQLKSNKSNTTKIERALIETEQKLNAVIAKSPILLFSIDEGGMFTLFKGMAMDQLGLTEGDVLGKSVFEIYSKLPVKLQDLKNALLGKEFTQYCEFNNRHFEVHYIPVKRAGGGFAGAMGIVTDVTGHKEHEKELKNQVILAAETQKIKENFLASMSHEIRTPIHGIISLSKIVSRTELNKEQNNYLNAIKKSADNLLVIINDILDISKMDSEKMTFENICFNMRELLTTVLELFKARAAEKNISVLLDYDKSLPDLFKGDPVRLSQIINNIVGNAIKFTEKGSVTLQLKTVDSNNDCSVISFKVIDTGIGIPQNKLPKIFDSFSQVGADTTRKYGGTGLGLSIAKKLVELQNGIISVESTLNVGTTFTFNMPFNHPEPGEVEEAASTTIDKHTNLKKKVKLLVVEDNDINRLIVNKHINDWGFEHDIAENGVIACEKIMANEYDVVLMDIEMPEMNGYEATEKIRSTFPENKKSIPILAMTAHATPTEKDKCLKLGMNDYISKPFDPIDVKNKIVELAFPNLQNEVEQTKAEEEAKPAATVERPAQRLTNLEFLRQMSDSTNSFFIEFIQLFLKNTPDSLNDLSNALKVKDWEKIRQVAHKMKPSMNYIGLKQTYEIVQKLEQNAKQQIHLDEVPEMISKISDACQIAFLELEEELKTVVVKSA
ncbi:MAG TPA: response regulator [Bacteroidia bacterium]|nr:response regulator [Bacteroidia bacterium]HNU33702.1 response regulator [Bacteroidia bacterium]